MLTSRGLNVRIICEDNLDEDLTGYQGLYVAFSPPELVPVSARRSARRAAALPSVVELSHAPPTVTTAIFLPTRSSIVLMGESFLTMNSAWPFDPRSASLSGSKRDASVRRKQECGPGYAAGVEIAADDARDRVRAHDSWRYVESFGLEETLLQGQVDDAVVRDRETRRR